MEFWCPTTSGASCCRPSKHVDFWQIADRVDAVRLHYDAPDGEQRVRHHPVYVDLVRLLSDPEFRAEAKGILGQIPAPDHVVIPDNPSASTIQDIVQEAFPELPRSRVAVVQPGRLADYLGAELASANRILCVDDCIVTGLTMNRLHDLIRNVAAQHGTHPMIDAFVFLARPKNEEDLRGIKRRYREKDGTHFRYARLLHFPEARTQHCPWCVVRLALRGHTAPATAR